MFNFLKLQAFSQSGYVILHSCQWRVRVLVAPRFCKHLVVLLFKKKSFYLFLIGRYLLYNSVWVSAIHQHGSALDICMSLPSWTSLQPPPHPTPLHCHRALGLSPQHHTVNSHGLPISPMVMYVYQRYFLTLPLLPLLCPQICSLICVSIAARQIGSSVPSS